MTQRSYIDSQALADWREVGGVGIQTVAQRNCRGIKYTEVVGIGALRKVHQRGGAEYCQAAE